MLIDLMFQGNKNMSWDPLMEYVLPLQPDLSRPEIETHMCDIIMIASTLPGLNDVGIWPLTNELQVAKSFYKYIITLHQGSISQYKDTPGENRENVHVQTRFLVDEIQHCNLQNLYMEL